jgi:hypothetical protein
MLILDSFHGHTTEEVKETLKSRNTDQVIIPGGLTSMLQLLDVCINRPFKVTLKEQYTQWMAAGEHEFMPDAEQLCEWIREACSLILPALIEKSFKKCGISNKLDGTEDEYLWDSDPDHVSPVDDEESSGEKYL